MEAFRQNSCIKGHSKSVLFNSCSQFLNGGRSEGKPLCKDAVGKVVFSGIPASVKILHLPIYGLKSLRLFNFKILVAEVPACFNGPAKLPTYTFQFILCKEAQFLPDFICFYARAQGNPIYS